MPAIISSVGAVTGHGLGARRFFDALLHARTAIRKATRFDTAGLCSDLAAEAPEALGVDAPSRCARLLLAAAAEALRDRERPSAERRAVLVGTTKGALETLIRDWERGLPSGADPLGEPARQLADFAGARGPVLTFCAACASSTVALGQALELIDGGDADEVLVAGAEALHPFVYAGFHSLKALSFRPAMPFDANRTGLSLGEGSGALVLLSPSFAKKSRSEPLAVLHGAGSASDAHDQTAPEPHGRGLSLACRAALRRADCPETRVAAYVAHGTATAQNDAMEAACQAALFGERPIPLTAFKGSIGHTLGASGALDAIAATLALSEGRLPPVTNLLTPDPGFRLRPVVGRPIGLEGDRVLVASAGFGGINAALVLGP